MGLIEIAYFTTRDEKTVQSLVQLMQVLERGTFTFNQLLGNMSTNPRYLRFLIGKLRGIELLRGNWGPDGSYRY